MSANDVPQRDDVIVARGRQAEGGRLAPPSVVVIGINGFDNMLPPGKAAKRRDASLRLRALGGKNALRTGTADAVELRGVGQRGFLVMPMLRGQNGRLPVLRGFGHGRAARVLAA